MIYLVFLLFLLLAIAIVVITHPLTVLFHELGHALPALLLTRQKVTVYLGSHGDPTNSIRCRLGLLEIWMKRNPFWMRGLCVPSGREISFSTNLLYTACGPVASLLIASVAAYFTFLFDLHGALKLVLVLFLLSSVFDLFMNLVPSSQPIVLFDGTIVFNDGYQLVSMIRNRKHWLAYKKAADTYYRGDYEGACVQLEQLIAEGYDNDNPYRALISSYIFTGRYEQVYTVFAQLEKRGGLSSVEYYHLGVAQVALGQVEESLPNFQKAIDLNADDSGAYNYMGCAYLLMDEYAKAIPSFDRALHIDPSIADAYTNRAEAKLRLGYTGEAYEDLQQSLQLDAASPYIYRNLGLYYIKTKEPELALAYLAKAKELCSALPMVEEYITEARALSASSESVA